MDEGEPVHGDVGTVAVLADVHAVSGVGLGEVRCVCGGGVD